MPDYTKGGWHYNKALGRIFARIAGPTDSEFLAEVAIISNDNTPEAEANAHLIAAAPDVYEALKEARITLALEGYEESYPAIVNADKALAKADSK